MDETCIKVAGLCKYFYRAVDRTCDRVDFLLTVKRDLAAAQRLLERATNLYGLPDKITIDKSGANTTTIESVKVAICVDILMRQKKYLNNIVEQDHRAIKRISDQCSNSSPFECPNPHRRYQDDAHGSQGAVNYPKGTTMSAIRQFYSLAV